MREVAEERGSRDEHEVVVALVDEELDRVLALEEEVWKILQRRQSRHAHAQLERTVERGRPDVPPDTRTTQSVMEVMLSMTSMYT